MVHTGLLSHGGTPNSSKSWMITFGIETDGDLGISHDLRNTHMSWFFLNPNDELVGGLDMFGIFWNFRLGDDPPLNYAPPKWTPNRCFVEGLKATATSKLVRAITIY